MPDSHVSSMGSAFTETGYPPTADRDGDRKLARLRTPADQKRNMLLLAPLGPTLMGVIIGAIIRSARR
jgi:hypothetical protein